MNPQQNAHITLLLQQNRLPEAEAALKSALAGEPDDFEMLLLLAATISMQNERSRDPEALQLIEAALRLEPESDRAHAWKARILSSMRRRPEALASAETAVELNVSDAFNWASLGEVHADARRWKEAEDCAREALALDPGYETAQDLLSRALLIQGRSVENESFIAARLADDPEDPVVRYNAGGAALRRGQHREASEHFAAALQIDPQFEAARDGLIESFRARSFFYRWYLAFSFRLLAISERLGVWLFVGLYVVYRVVLKATESIDPRLSYSIAAVWVTFVLWSFVAPGLSTFFLLADRFARMALKRSEKIEAIVVGGGFALGLPLFLFGLLALGSVPVTLTGGALMAQAIPASIFFAVESRASRWLYGSISYFVWTCAAIALFFEWTGLLPGLAQSVATVGMFAVLGCTFLALFNVAKR